MGFFERWDDPPPPYVPPPQVVYVEAPRQLTREEIDNRTRGAFWLFGRIAVYWLTFWPVMMLLSVFDILSKASASGSAEYSQKFEPLAKWVVEHNALHIACWAFGLLLLAALLPRIGKRVRQGIIVFCVAFAPVWQVVKWSVDHLDIYRIEGRIRWIAAGLENLPDFIAGFGWAHLVAWGVMFMCALCREEGRYFKVFHVHPVFRNIKEAMRDLFAFVVTKEIRPVVR